LRDDSEPRRRVIVPHVLLTNRRNGVANATSDKLGVGNASSFACPITSIDSSPS